MFNQFWKNLERLISLQGFRNKLINESASHMQDGDQSELLLNVLKEISRWTFETSESSPKSGFRTFQDQTLPSLSHAHIFQGHTCL